MPEFMTCKCPFSGSSRFCYHLSYLFSKFNSSRTKEPSITVYPNPSYRDRYIPHEEVVTSNLLDDLPVSCPFSGYPDLKQLSKGDYYSR